MQDLNTAAAAFTTEFLLMSRSRHGFMDMSRPAGSRSSDGIRYLQSSFAGNTGGNKHSKPPRDFDFEEKCIK